MNGTETKIELTTVNTAPQTLDANLSPGTSQHLQTNSQTLIAGPNLQKVVLEDINIDDEYMNELSEDATFKQFKFQILNSELKTMIDNSILDTSNANKPFRYLTGNFIKIFEKHVEAYEKTKIPIQKRNNIVYEESLRNNTVYLRINGDCKLCPKMNRVKYVFMIRNKPDDNEKFVEVEGKRRGIHNHNGFQNGENLTPKAKRLSLQPYTNQNDSNKFSIVAKKRKYVEDDFGLSTKLSPNVDSNANTTASSVGLTQLGASNLTSLDRNLIAQLSNQITNKIMIKLDQINIKVNQISDRLYDLERKLETVEVADIQLIN